MAGLDKFQQLQINANYQCGHASAGKNLQLYVGIHCIVNATVLNDDGMQMTEI